MGKNKCEFHIRNPAQKLHWKMVKKNEMQKEWEMFSFGWMSYTNRKWKNKWEI